MTQRIKPDGTMGESTHTRGSRGESIAEVFLCRKGHTVLARNYRDSVTRCEIDLITRDGEELVFVEVKTASGRRFGDPQSRVDAKTAPDQITRAAHRFLQERRWYALPCRFDVIGVDLSLDPPRITHIEHAFWSTV
jgi:putative endonuclease